VAKKRGTHYPGAQHGGGPITVRLIIVQTIFRNPKKDRREHTGDKAPGELFW
jgi:hypothetical protein